MMIRVSSSFLGWRPTFLEEKKGEEFQLLNETIDDQWIGRNVIYVCICVCVCV